MHERRNEPFRYSFHVPLAGFYNKKFSRHVSGPLQVNDISLNGLRFCCDPHPGLSMKDEVFLSFIYEHETFTAEGRVIWLKTEDHTMWCGIHVLEYPKRLKQTIQQLGDSLEKNTHHLFESKSP